MCITLQTDFGPIHMLTMDSNTLCTTDIEQWKLVTKGWSGWWQQVLCCGQ